MLCAPGGSLSGVSLVPVVITLPQVSTARCHHCVRTRALRRGEDRKCSRRVENLTRQAKEKKRGREKRKHIKYVAIKLKVFRSETTKGNLAT